MLFEYLPGKWTNGTTTVSFPSPLSLHMELCALSLLGLCDRKATQNRHATPNWCSKSSLSEKEREKIMFLPLCPSHGTHPEHVTPDFETPPLKRSKSDPPATPTSQRISSTGPGSLPITPPDSGGEKLCHGVNNQNLEEFIEYKYGFTFPDEEGYPWGEKLRGWTTYRARLCTRVVFSKKERCEECHRLHHTMQSARTRDKNSAREGTQKFTPTSTLKVSPYVRDLIEQFRTENKPTHQEEKEIEDIIEVELSHSINSIPSTQYDVFVVCRTRRTMITW